MLETLSPASNEDVISFLQGIVMIDEPMLFEQMTKLFLGNSADQIAGTVNCYRERKKWLLKIIKKMKKMVLEVETSEAHKQCLMQDLEELDKIVRVQKESDIQMHRLIDRLFLFMGHFLGLIHSQRGGARVHSLAYWQDKDQRSTERIISQGDDSQLVHEQRDAISVRGQIIKELREKGFDDYKIALVLNISEYQVKKIARELQCRG